MNRVSAIGALKVLIPVHNAFDSLQACLGSIDRSSPDAHVLVVDDASTDGRIRPLLQEWCAQSDTRGLLVLASNRGFVGAVNEGAKHLSGDIVLLNSDTVVTTGWLQRLAECLASDPAIATATPWSNNAEIASVPQFCQSNPLPADPDRWARACQQLADEPYPELPTAVGFCMAISAHARQTLGLFNEQVFGKGYGEENDFSLRAAAAGLRNVLCTTAFVAHRGGQSFAPLGLKPDQASMQRLLGLHPDYLEMIGAWIKRDPVRSLRERLVLTYQRSE